MSGSDTKLRARAGRRPAGGVRAPHSVSRLVLVTVVRVTVILVTVIIVTALQLSDALLEGCQSVVARDVERDAVSRHGRARRAVLRGHLVLAADALHGDIDVLHADAADVSHALQLLSGRSLGAPHRLGRPSTGIELFVYLPPRFPVL